MTRILTRIGLGFSYATVFLCITLVWPLVMLLGLIVGFSRDDWYLLEAALLVWFVSGLLGAMVIEPPKPVKSTDAAEDHPQKGARVEQQRRGS